MSDDIRSLTSNTEFTPDDKIIDEIEASYARILDQAALNVASPLAANVGYFNTTQKVYADDERVGKTIVFMTRPNLNLRSYNNVRRCRLLNYFSSSPLGITLMRYLMYGRLAGNMVYGYYPTDVNTDFKSFSQSIPIVGSSDDTVIGGRSIIEQSFPIVDTNFIPLVTNMCTNVSNGKDLTLDTFETEGNFSGDKLVYAGGIDENFSTGEITLTFDDIYSSPVMILFLTWIYYMHYEGKGLCDPEWNYIVNRIIDYSASLYVFVLGSDQETIVRWTKYSGLFPRSFPLGQIQHSAEIDKSSLRNVSIPCSYNFSNPMDPIVLSEFNMLAGPALYDRIAHASYPNGKLGYRDDIIKNMRGHFMSRKTALMIREVCPPNNVPTKMIDENWKNYGYMKSNFDSIDRYSSQRLNMLNRQSDNIENNWAGVPYITEGNKLMWL